MLLETFFKSCLNNLTVNASPIATFNCFRVMPRKLLPFGVTTVLPKTSQMFDREHSARLPFSHIMRQSSNAIDFASSSAITLFS